MVLISVMALLLCGFSVLSVCVSSQAGLTVEAGPGDDVTLWCEHGLTGSDYLFWCKHTNNSAPVYMACRYYSVSSSSSSSNTCSFITDSPRAVMEVNSVNSSLTITAVQDSDSGLYYCSSLKGKEMIFRTTTYLQIKKKTGTSSTLPDKSEVVYTFDVFRILSVVFGAVIVLLLFLMIVQFKRKQQKDDSMAKMKPENEEPDGEMVNYAAIYFSNKKNKRSGKNLNVVDPNVIYSSVSNI